MDPTETSTWKVANELNALKSQSTNISSGVDGVKPIAASVRPSNGHSVGSRNHAKTRDLRKQAVTAGKLTTNDAITGSIDNSVSSN